MNELSRRHLLALGLGLGGSTIAVACGGEAPKPIPAETRLDANEERYLAHKGHIREAIEHNINPASSEHWTTLLAWLAEANPPEVRRYIDIAEFYQDAEHPSLETMIDARYRIRWPERTRQNSYGNIRIRWVKPGVRRLGFTSLAYFFTADGQLRNDFTVDTSRFVFDSSRQLLQIGDEALKAYADKTIITPELQHLPWLQNRIGASIYDTEGHSFAIVNGLFKTVNPASTTVDTYLKIFPIGYLEVVNYE